MITIRQARSDEWQAVQALNDQVITDNAQYDPDMLVDWAQSPAGEAYYRNLVVDPSAVCFLAMSEENKPVGYLAASHKPIDYRRSKYLEIDNMGVMPEFRSQGVGAQLVEVCREWAVQNGYQKLFVNSYWANLGAIKFYKQQGFVEIDVSLERTV